MNPALADAAEEAARVAVVNVDPDFSDETIARLVADYLIASLPRAKTYHLQVLHDAKTPCPLPHDWRRRNAVGISTRDHDHAHRWVAAAMLAGYSVSRKWTRNSAGFGRGSIKDVRRRARAGVHS